MISSGFSFKLCKKGSCKFVIVCDIMLGVEHIQWIGKIWGWFFASSGFLLLVFLDKSNFCQGKFW